jgi:hypothetical protein
MPSFFKKLKGKQVPRVEQPAELNSLALGPWNGENMEKEKVGNVEKSLVLVPERTTGARGEQVVVPERTSGARGKQVVVPERTSGAQGEQIRRVTRSHVGIDSAPPTRPEPRTESLSYVEPNSSTAPPSSVPTNSIRRIGVANTCVGHKRLRGNGINEISGKEVKKAREAHWTDDPSEFKKMFKNLEYDPVVADAYTAYAPCDSPPDGAVASKEELVDGLLRAFKVPEYKCGPLPVLTEVDP